MISKWLVCALLLSGAVDSLTYMQKMRGRQSPRFYAANTNDDDLLSNRYFVRSVILEDAFLNQKQRSSLLETQVNSLKAEIDQKSEKVTELQHTVKTLQSEKGRIRAERDLQVESVDVYKNRAVLLEDGIGIIRAENVHLKQKLHSLENSHRQEQQRLLDSTDSPVVYARNPRRKVKQSFKSDDGVFLKSTSHWFLKFEAVISILIMALTKALISFKRIIRPAYNMMRRFCLYYFLKISYSVPSLALKDRPNNHKQLQAGSSSPPADFIITESTTSSVSNFSNMRL